MLLLEWISPEVNENSFRVGHRGRGRGRGDSNGGQHGVGGRGGGPDRLVGFANNAARMQLFRQNEVKSYSGAMNRSVARDGRLTLCVTMSAAS